MSRKWILKIHHICTCLIIFSLNYSPEVVERARNRMRIRIANIMMITTLIACLLVSISGRNARDRGESVTKANLEWHRLEKEEKEKAS